MFGDGVSAVQFTLLILYIVSSRGSLDRAGDGRDRMARDSKKPGSHVQDLKNDELREIEPLLLGTKITAIS